MPTLNYRAYASEDKLLHLDSSFNDRIQQQHQMQGKESEKEIVLTFVWKMGTREQQLPGVEELSSSRAAPIVDCVMGNKAATCCL